MRKVKLIKFSKVPTDRVNVLERKSTVDLYS